MPQALPRTPPLPPTRGKRNGSLTLIEASRFSIDFLPRCCPVCCPPSPSHADCDSSMRRFAGVSAMGRAGLEPATLGLKVAPSRFGTTRPLWVFGSTTRNLCLCRIWHFGRFRQVVLPLLLPPSRVGLSYAPRDPHPAASDIGLVRSRLRPCPSVRPAPLCPAER
jgi:hypothetical protein